MLELLTIALFILGIGAVFPACRYLYAIYRRQKSVNDIRRPQQDLANMMILFQTMRDLLRQQKELVRELNENIDAKIGLIRKTIGSALDHHEKLVRAQRELTKAVQETKADLASIQRQVAYAADAGRPEAPLRSDVAGITVPDVPRPPREQDANVRKAATDFSDLAGQPAASAHKEPSGRPGPQPQESENQPDEPANRAGDHTLVDNWVGLDFKTTEDTSVSFDDAPEAPPESPEDPERAREAFRALLNMETNPGESPAGPRRSALRGGNGQGRVPPLHARVYEYSDAGMTVAQIARELGVGKGEVRLILSLRADKEQ